MSPPPEAARLRAVDDLPDAELFVVARRWCYAGVGFYYVEVYPAATEADAAARAADAWRLIGPDAAPGEGVQLWSRYSLTRRYGWRDGGLGDPFAEPVYVLALPEGAPRG